MASTKSREGDKSMEVVPRNLDDLIPYINNARTHSDSQVAQIAASLIEFGWTNPILTNGNSGIAAGHGRLMAAKKVRDSGAQIPNWEDVNKAPTIDLAHLSKTQIKAYIIADNKLAENAGWDDELLKIELEELKLDEFDLSTLGFNDDELEKLLSGITEEEEGLSDPDEVPEPEPNPISRQGDIWILGRHRIMCGDSTNAEHVSRLMSGATADLCFTSPPYAQQRNYKSGGIADWDSLMQGVFSILPVKHEAQVLINLGMVHRDGEWVPYWDDWVSWMRSAGWRRFGWYVWDQGPGMPGDWNGRLAPSHEFIFHFNRVAERARKTQEKMPQSVTKNRSVMRRKDGTLTKAPSSPESGLNTHKIPDSVIRVMRHKHDAGGERFDHPAPFPVDLVSEMLTAFSDPDDLVFEPFCGSGTQLISAQKNGRSCFGMELAPIYTDVAIRRWQNFSGQMAKLEGDGRTFDEISESRQSDKAQLESAES